MCKRVFLLLLCLLSVLRLHAQADDPFITRPHRTAVLYAGPGGTYLQKGIVQSGVELRIVERNRIGDWLRVQRGNAPNFAIDAWVMRGYITLNPALDYTQVPVTTLPDGDPSTLFSQSLKKLAETPVIPPISALMQLVFEQGQSMGRQANVVTKVGDSVIANPFYLKPFSQDDYVLGAYRYLEDTVRYYGASMAADSVAAQVGMTSYVVFDPLWANINPNCEPNETPLACEYRTKNPSIAFISFGANDVKHMPFARFEAQMREIIQETLASGIIPVLTTFSVAPDYEYYEQAIKFNVILVDLAQEFSVPLINLWLAARPLPAYGLDVDGIHMLQTGFRFIKLDTGLESWYGVGLQNLLAIRTLHEIRTTLGLELTP